MPHMQEKMASRRLCTGIGGPRHHYRPSGSMRAAAVATEDLVCCTQKKTKPWCSVCVDDSAILAGFAACSSCCLLHALSGCTRYLRTRTLPALRAVTTVQPFDRSALVQAILKADPDLRAHSDHLMYRWQQYTHVKQMITEAEGSLKNFALVR